MTRCGITLPRRRIAPDEVVPYLLAEFTRAPELWLQRSYLGRVLTTTNEGAIDEGILPLGHFVDSDGPDALAAVIELDAAGESSPVLYVRRRGEVTEHRLEGSALLEFDTPAHRLQLSSILDASAVT